MKIRGVRGSHPEQSGTEDTKRPKDPRNAASQVPRGTARDADKVTYCPGATLMRSRSGREWQQEGSEKAAAFPLLPGATHHPWLPGLCWLCLWDFTQNSGSSEEEGAHSQKSLLLGKVASKGSGLGGERVEVSPGELGKRQILGSPECPVPGLGKMTLVTKEDERAGRNLLESAQQEGLRS